MDYEVIIIGAGSMGMAAGCHLAKQGRRVLLIDAHDPPHTEGSHHGETRIIRHAYGEGESYVEMALHAQELWHQLQEESDEEIFIPTGVVNIAKPDSVFMQNVISSAKNYALEVEKLTADEINQRWTGFQVPEGYIGCYEVNSGVLMSENCIRAFRKQAKAHGAVLRTNTAVRAVSISEDSVEVETDDGMITAKSLILAAGAGTRKLLPLIGLELPLQEVRKTFSWFETDESIYGAADFPAFSFDLPDEIYYGFPSINKAGVKIGRHDGGVPRCMDKPLDPFGSRQEDKQEATSFANLCLPKVGAHKSGKTCTYTNTPDEDFIIDKHPDHEHVVIACGFSGHGFKFSSAVGEILSQMVTGNGKPELDISPFSMKRFTELG